MCGGPGVRELYLSSHKKKRMKQMKKMMSRGLVDPENEDPFSLFVSSTVRPRPPAVAPASCCPPAVARRMLLATSPTRLCNPRDWIETTSYEAASGIW